MQKRGTTSGAQSRASNHLGRLAWTGVWICSGQHSASESKGPDTPAAHGVSGNSGDSVGEISRDQRWTDLYGVSFLLSKEGKFAELSEEFCRKVGYS